MNGINGDAMETLRGSDYSALWKEDVMKTFRVRSTARNRIYEYAIIGNLIVLALIPAAYGEGPTFEVASIKPAPSPEPGLGMRVGCSGGPATEDPIRWTCENMSLSNLVLSAFGLSYFQLKSQSSLDDERFNVTAKLPDGATKEQFLHMQQNLLLERFGLKFHYEQKEMQGYELVVAKNGPKFRESEPEPPKDPSPTTQAGPAAETKDGFPFTRGRDGLPTIPKGMTGYWMSGNVARGQWVRTTVEKIALFLSDQVGAPVADSTGLKGEYDLSLEWTPEAPNVMPTASESSFPSLLTAIQEQLGLKLQSKKVTIEIFVIDHTEKTPTEN
jgi:uncharacterized protein (TIGR03435 family)